MKNSDLLLTIVLFSSVKCTEHGAWNTEHATRSTQHAARINFNSYFHAWGPPRVKVRHGKVSWTERQIGMLLSYFVLIKLSVIKMPIYYEMHLISYIKCK